MKIRDLRNGEWFWVNNAVMTCPHIDAEDFRVYSVLASFGGMPEIRPTMDTIAKRACISVRKANYSVKRLTEVGFVEIKIGGGRGRANVYDLLKAVKGCITCRVSKPRTDEQETPHGLTLNPAQHAGHKDIYKDKQKDIGSAPRSDKSFKFNPLGAEVLKAFEVVDPKNKTYYGNTTQRGACDFLIAEYGLDKVVKAVGMLPAINQQKLYIRQITSPYELKENWVKIANALAQKKNDTKYKVAF